MDKTELERRLSQAYDKDTIPKKEKKPAEKVANFRIVKVDQAQQIVGGIVYEPNVVDTQGDYTDKESIQKALYGFMEKYYNDSKRIKVMHQGTPHSFPILECFQAEEDTKKGGQIIKAGGWWLMIKVTNADIWKGIVDGRFTGFSMGGVASGE